MIGYLLLLLNLKRVYSSWYSKFSKERKKHDRHL